MLSCDHVSTHQIDPAYHGSCFICAAAAETDAPHPARRSLLRTAVAAPFAALTAAAARPVRADATPDNSRAVPSGAFVIRCGAALLEKDDALAVEHDVDILVRDGAIADISRAAISGFPVLDATRHLVLPGFISGHTHCCSGTPTRGIFEAGRSYREPLQLVEQLSDDEQDALTALNMAELLRSGCTTHVEMSLTLRQAESYVRVAKAWGVRGFPGPMIPNTTRLFDIWFRTNDDALFASENGTLDEIAAALAFGKRHMGDNAGLIQPMMTAHATDTHTEATMRALKAACDELGTGLHLHFAQGRAEPDAVKRLWGMTPTAWLDSFGLLDQPVFGAHMSGVDWSTEGATLKAKGVVYAHCPSGGGAGGGSQPYPEALAAGVPTNIGIDTHSNDYVENLKLAVLYGKNRARHLGASSRVPLHAPTILEALDGATRVPADALKRSDLGRLKVGAQADIVSIDVGGLLAGSGAMPPEPIYNLLYCNGLMVRHVMTRGRIQVLDGQLTVGDENEILSAGGAVAEKIWVQLERDGWFGQP